MAALLSMVDDDDENERRRGQAYNFLKFKKVFEIRWLCLVEAVKAVIHNYEPLMILLEEESAQGDLTAQGLHRQLTSYRYVAMLHLVGDILQVTNHLNRIFQYRDISFMSIESQISGVLQTLNGLRDVDEDFLWPFLLHCNEDTGYRYYTIQMRTQPGRGKPHDQMCSSAWTRRHSSTARSRRFEDNSPTLILWIQCRSLSLGPTHRMLMLWLVGEGSIWTTFSRSMDN
ncbi:hypothetical protein GJAV_G00076780 [Gymnothorax javanicus]|nr:hypothetical protein GJAV_G00076780 [Gymnothorax javanicus]